MILRLGRPAVSGLFVIEPARQWPIAVLVAASTTTSSAPATATTAATLALVVVTAISRGCRLAAVARPRFGSIFGSRFGSLARRPGRGRSLGPRRADEVIGVMPRNLGWLAILPLGRLAGRSPTAEGKLVLLAIAAAGRRFHGGP